MKRILPIVALAGSLVLLSAPAAFAQEHEAEVPPMQKWSFAGPFGKYDQAQIQRGFKVYKEVCSVCHSLELVSFRNLTDPNGPGYSAAQAAAVAADAKIKDIDDQGQPTERPGRPADHFPSPFANDAQARAVHGAVPPDMSVLAKARTYERGFPRFLLDILTQYQEQGPDYIVALMHGYEKAPANVPVPEGAFYNKYFPAGAIKMPKPLSDGQVTYDDGSPQTVDQYSKDVAAFLMWTAEPTLPARKRLGFQVMIFLIVLSGLLYFTKKKVWAGAH
jgi:ubiquinol-cytochrome c reductase cytochrome b/c1 subunit